MIVLVALAFLAGVADVRTQQIPNGICLGVTFTGIGLQLVRAVSRDLLPLLPVVDRTLASSLPAPAATLAFAMAFLLVAYAAERIHRSTTGRRGMGLGDVKYLSSWATVLGPLVLAPLALACLAGAVSAGARHRETFPLGPWASTAFVGTLVWLVAVA